MREESSCIACLCYEERAEALSTEEEAAWNGNPIFPN